MNKELIRTGECLSCGECCKKMRITTPLSNMLRQHNTVDEAKSYYIYRGFRIADVNEKQNLVLLEAGIPCAMLTYDNKCEVHNDPARKPFICQKYPWFDDEIETCGFSFKEKETAG